MKILSFDIEIYDDLVENEPLDFTKIRPSVAATCTNKNDVTFYYDKPLMSKDTACHLVEELYAAILSGYTVFTWNGLHFDFPVLAYYSGKIKECAKVALNSVDGMLLVTFNRGHFLGLDAALHGAGVESKVHSVTLNNGSSIDDMSGKKAPELWRNGEYDAVMQYLRGDVIQPLLLAEAIEKNKGIKWFSKTGRQNYVYTDLVVTKNLFSLPFPNTSWMTDPPKRQDFVDWIPNDVLTEQGIRL